MPPRGRGRRRHLPRHRLASGSPLRRAARPAAALERDRRLRQRRPDRRRAPATGPGRVGRPLPAQGHARRHLLPHRQHAVPAGGGAGRALPLVSAPPRGDRRRLPRLRGTQAHRPPARPRRPLALLARARTARTRWTEACRDVRPRPRRRVPGRERPAGRHRQGVPRPQLWPDGRRGRLPGDLRLPRRQRRAHPRLQRALPPGRGGDARAQLPLHPADPRRRQPGHRAGRAHAREDVAQRTRPRAAGRSSYFAGTRPRRRARSPSVCSPSTSRAHVCATRPC